MASRFFLVGHGIGYTNRAVIGIPAGVTVKFAVPVGWRSTGTVSTACMRGDLNIYSEIVTGPGLVSQHFLCPDTPQTHLNKLIAFNKGVANRTDRGNNYLLCVRGAYEVSLSGIISRIERIGVSKPYELVWTCCRSPINEISPGTVYFEGGKRVFKNEPAQQATTSPSDKRNKVMASAADGILTIISGDDIVSVPSDQFGKTKLGKGSYDATALFGLAHDSEYAKKSDGHRGLRI